MYFNSSGPLQLFLQTPFLNMLCKLEVFPYSWWTWGGHKWEFVVIQMYMVMSLYHFICPHHSQFSLSPPLSADSATGAWNAALTCSNVFIPVGSSFQTGQSQTNHLRDKTGSAVRDNAFAIRFRQSKQTANTHANTQPEIPGSSGSAEMILTLSPVQCTIRD